MQLLVKETAKKQVYVHTYKIDHIVHGILIYTEITDEDGDVVDFYLRTKKGYQFCKVSEVEAYEEIWDFVKQYCDACDASADGKKFY